MTTPEYAHDKVTQLVHKFKALSPAARRQMNEDATRQGYILPLFRALGWDTDDVNEVSPEERVSKGWVDFAFRLGGIPRFFLETKKASEDLNDPRWVKQAIDYAWHKSVTWALLSDFEGLRVFNAEWQEADPFRAQFLAFTVDTYLSDFEKLWWLSRPEAAAGTLDREAEKVGRKIRRVPVTQNLFDDLKQWRNDLHTHLRQYNPLWSAADVDQSVLRILNRLIFLRTAEDREVEPRRLEPLVRELGDARKLNELPRRLAALFREMDAVYDSELFAPHLSETLDCEPAPFERLIKGLYERNYTRYNFNAIDADVLGTVYEQYLGHVVAAGAIRESPVLVEKRQKRKSQGIYYTPTFVVKYIVQNTLGRYLQEHDYHPARPVRVLDMACGSGSFLIEAFDVLDRHIGQLRATHFGSASHVFDHARAVEILTQCLYGVDKDRQAVEVARLNLMLRGLHSRDKLPRLDNLRVGDSLISGPPEELQAAFGKEWKAKQPFNWEQEFPEVFSLTPRPPLPTLGVGRGGVPEGDGGEGGFDVIVGNPPYVRIQTLPKDEVAFFNERYQAATGNYDIYVLFVERALQLLKPGGVMGLILPNKFFNTAYGAGLRKLIAEAKALWRVVDFGSAQVFGEATTYTCLLFLQKQANEQFIYIDAGNWLSEQTATPMTMPDNLAEHTVKATVFAEGEWNFSVGRDAALLERLATMPMKLADIAERIFQGLVTGADPVFILEDRGRGEYFSEATRKKHKIEHPLMHPLCKGSVNIKRYHVTGLTKSILFPYKLVGGKAELLSAKELRERFPNAWGYLKSNRSLLESREGGKWKHNKWYAFGRTQNLSEMEQSKILTPSIANVASFTYDHAGAHYFVGSGGGGGGGYGITLKSDEYLYILGLLNSRLLDFYLKSISSPFRHGYYAYNKQYIERLPIRRINFDDPAEKRQHDEIVQLVTEMLELQKERAEAERGLDDDRQRRLARRIEELDRAIDAEVYKLYGLKEEEIRIVEAGK